ncbi:M61 family metallopeptidase [Roseateles chitosanitabidus]|uniref:M61 family metallopeptidase n=1 Tax=Roseateles chitosanitabidus TaxID=65048 RepID=UPI00082BB29A|nr:hypothetical protein [Roseateles chitosanitabidus]
MRAQGLTLARGLSIAAALLLASVAAHADQACDLSYRITPRYDTTPRRLDVTMSFPSEGRHESAVRIQSGWAGIKDYGGSLNLATEQSAGVRVLPGEDGNRWKIEHEADDRVTLRYQVRAALPDPDDGQVQQQEQLYRTQIGADWFQFFGYGALLSVDTWGDERTARMCLTLVQPDGKVGPLLGSHFDGAVASHEDVSTRGPHSQLRHAFYAGGPGWRVIERRLATGPVVIASRGKQPTEDARFAEQVARLLDAHRRFWGDASAPRQTVARTPNHSAGNNGGTLVAQAAVLHVSQDPATSSDSFEFLIGHENLHLWIPNRLGGTINGSAEQVARHYWLSEGFTDYYTHRLLLSGGLWSLDRYADQVTQMLRGYWRSPARNATAENIAGRFFSDRNAGRQMYARGELLAMDWDRELRRTDPAGLDGLLRGLLLDTERAAKAPPAHERVMQALTATLGARPREQVKAYVVEGRNVELDEGLAGPCFQLGWSDVPRWVPGFDMNALAKRVATGVVPDGPAYRAGLRDGMTLQGWSIYGDNTDKDITLQLKTADGAKELRYRPVDGSTDRLPMLTVRAGAAGDASCQAWMRR